MLLRVARLARIESSPLWSFVTWHRERAILCDEGFAGTQLWAPRVLLVATHADRVASARRNSRGETEFPGESSLVTSLQKEFGAELLIAPRIYTLDARQAASADMKALKAVLGELKQFLCQVRYRVLISSTTIRRLIVEYDATSFRRKVVCISY
jgi:hypothetical protein